MNKMSYVKPVTEVQLQVYLETSILAGSGEDAFSSDDFKDEGRFPGLPTTGNTVGNPSFVRRFEESSNSQLWDDDL